VDDSNEDLVVVAFADEQDGELREQLHFQRAHQFDDQDVALGMDSVYVERNNQSQGGYAAIERVELHPDRVRVVVDGRMAVEMGDSEFVIALSLQPAEFDRLRKGLRAVFAGFPSLVEDAA
jgi:hypothetical protein